jgi:hypothetical protein
MAKKKTAKRTIVKAHKIARRVAQRPGKRARNPYAIGMAVAKKAAAKRKRQRRRRASPRRRTAARRPTSRRGARGRRARTHARRAGSR